MTPHLTSFLRYYLYRPGASSYLRSYNTNMPTYTHGDACLGFAKFHITKGSKFFMPICKCRSCIRPIYNYFYSVGDVDNIDIVFPLNYKKYAEAKTSEYAFKGLFEYSPIWLCTQISVGKEKIKFYGGNGLIFDENFKPLMIVGVEASFDDGIRTTKFAVHTLKCLVSPDVFRRKDALCKYIVREIIPYITTHEIYINWSGVSDMTNLVGTANLLEHNNVEVEVRNLNSYCTIQQRDFDTSPNLNTLKQHLKCPQKSILVNGAV